MRCDHWLGIDDREDGLGDLRASGAIEMLYAIERIHEHWAKNPHASSTVKLAFSRMSPAERVGGTFRLFKHCPDCGEPISLERHLGHLVSCDVCCRQFPRDLPHYKGMVAGIETMVCHSCHSTGGNQE